MEYVEGFDLARVVQAKGPLPLAAACQYVQQAAAGLQHAYENGIVHFNIKPTNLMLTRQGTRPVIKIVDYGLSQAGKVLGTPEFLAPEQTTDPRAVDIRADIYSLGCTLYFLLTGSPPFQAANLYDLLQAHQSMDAVPLNLARPDVPMPLAIIAATMMAKEPGRRFQTPAEVSQALSGFLKKEGPAPRVSSPEPTQPGAPSRFQLSQGVGVDLPTAPARAAEAAPPPPKPPKPAGSEWDTLIEVEPYGPLSEEVHAVRQKGNSTVRLVSSGVGVLGLVGVAVAVGMGLEARRHQNAPVAPPPIVASAPIPAPAAPRPTPAPSRPVEAPRPPAEKPALPPPVAESPPEPTPPPAETALARNTEPKAPSGLDTDRSPVAAPAPREPAKETGGDRPPNEAEKAKAARPDAELTPEEIIEKRGLKKASTFYVVGTESEFAAAWQAVVPHYTLMDAARTEWNQAIQINNYAQELNDRQVNLQALINQCNSLMGGANRDQKLALQAQIQNANAQLNLVQAEIAKVRTRVVGPVKMQQLQDEFMKRRGEFLEKSGGLRPILDRMTAEYEKLKLDTELRNALNTLKERKKVNVTLGPSAKLKSLVLQLRQAEEEVSFNPDAYRRRRKSPRLEGKDAPKGKSGAMPK